MGSARTVYWPRMSAEAAQWIAPALRSRPIGLLTDIDGTLSPIAPTPDQARLYRGVRPLLRRALDDFDLVAAISGRPALDARRMVGAPRMTYIGNHGMERLAPNARIPAIAPEARRYQNAIAETLHEARERLAMRFDHLLFENKGVTASIHYRQSAAPEAAHDAIRGALDPLAQAHGLRVTEGRMVVELRPPVNIDKGASVRMLAREYHLRCAVFLGDDHTDVDAFLALRDLRERRVCVGIAVAVLHAEAPPSLVDNADVTLTSIAEVPRFLRWVLEHMRA